MPARWNHWLEGIRASFWFVPLTMLFIACALAMGVLWLDGQLDPGINAKLPWAYTGGPSGAR